MLNDVQNLFSTSPTECDPTSSMPIIVNHLKLTGMIKSNMTKLQQIALLLNFNFIYRKKTDQVKMAWDKIMKDY